MWKTNVSSLRWSESNCPQLGCWRAKPLSSKTADITFTSRHHIAQDHTGDGRLPISWNPVGLLEGRKLLGGCSQPLFTKLLVQATKRLQTRTMLDELQSHTRGVSESHQTLSIGIIPKLGQSQVLCCFSKPDCSDPVGTSCYLFPCLHSFPKIC